jgi:hypothetical protein
LVDELRLFLLIAVSGALAGLVLLLIWGVISRAGMWLLDRIDPSRAFLSDEGTAAVTARWVIALLMFALIGYLIVGVSTAIIDGIAELIFR